MSAHIDSLQADLDQAEASRDELARALQEAQEGARSLRSQIAGVLSHLEKLSAPDAEQRAQIAMLKRWDAMTVQIGWPSNSAALATLEAK